MSRYNIIVEIDESNFESVVVDGSHAAPILVDFWAEWCQPCKMLMPVLANLAEEYQGKFVLAKVNTEEQQALAARFGIRSIPTVKLFVNGEPVDEFMGALPEAQIRTFLDRYIPRESDELLVNANQLMQQGDATAALKLIEEARYSDPGNPRIFLARARLEAAQGDIDAAERTLSELPMEEQDKAEVKALRARFSFVRSALAAPPPQVLQPRLAQHPDDAEARYQLAAQQVMDNDFDNALEQLLLLLQNNRDYGDDAARKSLLALFDILGADDPRVTQYRNRMFNALH